MATNPPGLSEVSLRGFIEAVGSAEAPHGAVSTAAVAGGLGSFENQQLTASLEGWLRHIDRGLGAPP